MAIKKMMSCKQKQSFAEARNEFRFQSL